MIFGSMGGRKGNESDIDYNRRMEQEDRIWNAAIEAAASKVKNNNKLMVKILELKK